jgi:hypothetical protein
MAKIPPVPRSVFLCREVRTHDEGTDLGQVFSTLTFDSFPAVEQFFVFFQLANGFGEVVVHLDIRRADDGRLVHSTGRAAVTFPDRRRVAQVVAEILDARFDRPGVYLVELLCDNVWVADATLDLREATT